MFLISGSSNLPLAQKISGTLKVPLADVEISKFPNGEKRIWIKSELKDQTVIIVQSFSDPVDEHIIELALISDAAKHLGSKHIVAVVPWMGYSPQDKEFRKGEPVSIHVIARIIESMGIDHLVTVDIHSQDSLEHFHIPTLEISALPIFIDYFQSRGVADHAVASLDKGALKDSTELAHQLKLPLITFDKFRDRSTGEVSLNHLSGETKHKHIIAFDDFVSTGSTRISASKILKSMGAASYTDCITHALLAGDSSARLEASDIDAIITTDTYFIPDHKLFPKLQIVSVSDLLATQIAKLVDGL